MALDISSDGLKPTLDQSIELIGTDLGISQEDISELKSKAKVIGHRKEEETDLIILNRSPFYVEAGGQIDDLGKTTRFYFSIF